MKTILVVDDMPIFREPIEAVLRAGGFQVLTAANGREAVAILATAQPDLVLLDLGMPVMGGLAVLTHMRREKASQATPVIILSADSDRGHIVAAAKLGIAGYVLKSKFSLQALMVLIEQTLDATTPQSAPAGESASKLKPAPASTAARDTPVPAPTSPQAPPPAGKVAPPASGGPAPPKPPVSPVREPLARSQPQEVRLAPVGDLKSLLPLMTRSELLARLTEDGELSGFSPTVSQVLKLTSSQKCSMDQVAQAVSQDQTVALKVMKLANSSIYSRGDRVETLHKAVLRIGMQSIRQAVLNIGVVERFGSPAFQQHLNTPLFWEHSIACGIIAAELAHGLGHKGPDAAFTAGLLHDLGRILYAERLGEQYVQALDSAQVMQLPVEQVESRLLLMNHAEAMNPILSAWKFPKDLVSPIVFHHADANDAKALAPHQTVDVLRLGLADRLAHAMMLGSSGNDTIYPSEEHCWHLGVESTVIRQIEETARQQTDDTKFALLSHSNSTAWPRHVEHYQAMLLTPFRPLYVSASPALDAYRIFCDELAGSDSSKRPNVAVVHIAASRERATLPESLATAEREARVEELPILMLSPAGKFVLDEAATAGRRCVTLATPTPVARFIAAVNALTAVDAVKSAA